MLKTTDIPSLVAMARADSRHAVTSPFRCAYCGMKNSHTRYDFAGSNAEWSWPTPTGSVGNSVFT
jgi:hypothetical protein